MVCKIRYILIVILFANSSELCAQKNQCAAKKAYSEFIISNSERVASLESDDFNDLQFFKKILEGKRIVFFGEYMHGIQEINSFKTRLLKFLHQELNYDVVLFESGIYECMLTNRNVQDINPQEALENSLYPIFRADGYLKLFNYIKSNSINIAGIDVFNTAYTNPSFFKLLISDTLGAIYKELLIFESEYNKFFFDYREQYVKKGRFNDFNRMKARKDKLQKQCTEIIALIKNNRCVWRESVCGIERKHVVRALENQCFLLSNLSCFKNYCIDEYMPLFESNKRDSCMYANLCFLKDTVFANKKILLLAHNGHISYKGNSKYKSFGSFLSDVEKKEVYNIGVYSCLNNFDVGKQGKPKRNFLENILKCSPYDYSFIDMSALPEEAGMHWMSDKVPTCIYGGYAIERELNKKYDGVFYIKESNKANYTRDGK